MKAKRKERNKEIVFLLLGVPCHEALPNPLEKDEHKTTPERKKEEREGGDPGCLTQM